MPEKRTVPKKQVLISPDGKTIANAIFNKVGAIIGWAVSGLSPFQGEGGVLKRNETPPTSRTESEKKVSKDDANLDY